MLAAKNQIVLLVWIGLEIVQFIQIPDAVVLDEFVAIVSQCERGRRVRKAVLPLVLIQNLLPPIGSLSLTTSQAQEALTVHLFGCSQPGTF